MRRGKLGKLVISVSLALPVLLGSLQAQDKKPAGKSLDLPAVDESIYQTLRDIIDRGASLYNRGDWNGCYRLWEGSLRTLKPFLDHRPKLQQTIDDGLASARQDPALWHRAWVLRPVLDKIRADINTDHPHGKKRENGSSKVAAPKSGKNTLWDRLGGERGVTKIVDDFVNLAAPDRKVDFFRGGKFQMTAEQVAKMKREIVEQISQASGGPLKYTGPDMKAVHKGMGITETQFNTAAGHLKKAMEKNNVAAEDVEKVLGAVGSYRKEIVQPKKKDEKKPAEKQPVDKKPAEKKEEKKQETTANIIGKVMYKGLSLTTGAINFLGKDNSILSAIAEDGTYKLSEVRPGIYKVTICTPPGGVFKPGFKPPSEAKPHNERVLVKIPPKYARVKTSGLTVRVKEGKQTQDFNLND